MPEIKPCRCGHSKSIHLVNISRYKERRPCARLVCGCLDYIPKWKAATRAEVEKQNSYSPRPIGGRL